MVPKVGCFQLDDIDIWFNSDDHMPPHFHAESEARGWHIKIRFLREQSDMVEQVSTKKPRPAEIKELLECAENFRAELDDEFWKKVVVKTPGPEK